MYSLTYYCCKCDLQFPIGSNKTICPKCGQDVTKQQIAGIRIPYKEPSNLDTIKELREDNNLLTRKLQEKEIENDALKNELKLLKDEKEIH